MIDKLYILLYEFKKAMYDMGKARRIFEKETPNLLPEEREARFSKWFSENKDDPKYGIAYKTPRFEKIKYDMDRAPQDQSRAARNNMLIDMMYSVLTSPEAAPELLRPGSFDSLKNVANIIQILTSCSREEMMEMTGTDNIKDAINKLLSFTIKETKALNKYKKRRNPLAPSTQNYFQQQNVVGKNMTAVYATHNSNHAVMQHTEVGLKEGKGTFTLNGKKLTSLHDVHNTEGGLITDSIAEFLNAAVDNAKDPVLAHLNQNYNTCDATMLLARLGYSHLEIGLLMNQPIIIEMIRAINQGKNSGQSRDTIIDGLLSKLKKRCGYTGNLKYEEIGDFNPTILSLAANIIANKEKNIDGKNIDNETKFYQNQLYIGILFKQILHSADALKSLTNITKADTNSGSLQAEVAANINKKLALRHYAMKAGKKNFPLSNAQDIMDLFIFPQNMGTDALRKHLLESKIPMQQAYTTLGVLGGMEFLQPYMAQYGPVIGSIVERISQHSRTGELDVRTIQHIINDFYTYLLTGTPEFTDNPVTGSTAFEKRQFAVNTYPPYFEKIVAQNPDIAKLEFIKKLKVVKIPQTGTWRIVFTHNGKLTQEFRDKYTREWEYLMYMNNPEANQLALNLLEYCLRTNGYAHGQKSFIHLAPIAVQQMFPEYVNTLRKAGGMLASKEMQRFEDQFMYNHLNFRRLVPEVKIGSSVQFTQNGQILDTVEFDPNKLNSRDSVIIKGQIERYGKLVNHYFKYIARRVNKYDTVYYKLVDKDNGMVTYERIRPLGIKNNYLEYEYGKSIDEMQSALPYNYANIKVNEGAVRNSESDDEGEIIEAEANQTPTAAEETSDAEKALVGTITANDDKSLNSITPEPKPDANDQDQC